MMRRLRDCITARYESAAAEVLAALGAAAVLWLIWGVTP